MWRCVAWSFEREAWRVASGRAERFALHKHLAGERSCIFCTRGRSKIIGDIAALESASLEQDVKQFLKEHAVNLAVRNSANETSRSKLTLSNLSVASFCESEQKGFRHRAQSLGLS